MIKGLIKYVNDLNKNYVIFDIGARDCLQSIEFYNNFPNSKIYSFECNPNTLKICENNIKKFSDRIKLIKGAVADYNGKINFYPINQKKTRTSWKDGNPGASSIFLSNGQYKLEKYVQDKIVTNCFRLDYIIRKNNIKKVDIIWMDLQGAELLALKSLGENIYNVEFIYTEVSYKEIYTGQVMFNEIHNYILSKNFEILNTPVIYKNKKAWQDNLIYKRKRNEFDIVICLGKNDVDIIKKQIEFTKKYILGYRNIYIIPYDPTINIQGCITINENIFPFNNETIYKITGNKNRSNWYLQQLLKLYSGIIIKDLLDKYLVIDADTFFLKHTSFIENGKCLYNYEKEYNIRYFDHMKKFDINLKRVDKNKSGVCHHMIFESIYIKELINIIEKKHNDFFYNIFLKNIEDVSHSGASEYEIYFNYMLKNHDDKIKLRKLNNKNIKGPDFNPNDYQLNSEFDYISYHSYARNKK